jgi:hypothetical protein
MEYKQDDFVRSTVQSEFCIFTSQLGDEGQTQEKNEYFQAKVEYPSLNKLMMSDYIVNNNFNNENSYQENEEDLLNIMNNAEEKLDENKKLVDNQEIAEISLNENSEDELDIQSKKNLEDKQDPSISINLYEVIEKCEIRDYIGSHKVYEISCLNSFKKEKNIKSFRRYQNFDVFDKKLKKSFPYYIIPRLPPKNPLAKIISADSEFYENRRIQLNNYLNFIKNNENLSKTKEFLKFVNDAEFDQDFFESEETNVNYNFPESSKLNETVTNKIYGIFSTIFTSTENERRINDSEKNLKRMEMDFKFVTDKCNNIKDNINIYLKSIIKNSEFYKKISSNCLYLKDTMERIDNSKENFKKLEKISADISEVNLKAYLEKGNKIKNKIEVKFFF